MTMIITNGSTILTPLQVLGYKHTREYGNDIYRVINASAPEVTYDVPGLRKGTLTMLCDTLAAALAMDQLHTNSGTFALADSTFPELNMTYVPVGECTVELDEDSHSLWIVAIGFQEVS
jgi:hypothetical protein